MKIGSFFPFMALCVVLLSMNAFANDPPVPSFSYSPRLFVVVNQSISFNASASSDPDGSVASYVWDFGDGNTETTSEPVIDHSYLAAGYYVVVLDLVDDEGLESDLCFSDNVIILERGDGLTIKDGWEYEGLLIDYGYLFDVSVAGFPDGGFRLYGGDGITSDHEVVSYYSADGLNFSLEDGYRLEGLGFMQYVVNLSDGRYRMYYTGGNAVKDLAGAVGSEAIRSAISSDGLNFSLEDEDRFFYDSGSSYESGGIRASRILELPDGSYRMYYHALEDIGTEFHWRVLSAVSADGLNWTREAGVRLDSEDLCAGSMSLHNVAPARDSEGTYHLYVAGGLCGEETWNVTEGIFDASSSDGLKFTLDSTPVVAAYHTEEYRAAPHDPFVVNAGGSLRMYFGVYDGPDVIPDVSGIYSVSFAGCSLKGDHSPCGTVSLSEVVSYINSWSSGTAELSDVVALINAWSG